MKRMHVLLGLLALSTAVLVSIATAQETYTYYPTLWIQSKQNNAMWGFDTVGVDWSFSGKDVSTILARYMIYTGDPNSPVEEWHTIEPKIVHHRVSSVNLVFARADLPPYANLTQVIGTLTSGETFLAAGPGFTWSNVH